MRVQIYTNDREQPIDLEVLEMRSKPRGINTNGNGQKKEPSVDQTVREVIKDPAIGKPPLHDARRKRRRNLPEHGESRCGCHVLVEWG